MKPRKSTRTSSLVLARKPAMPRGRVILDRKTKARRRRRTDQFWLDSQVEAV